MKRFLLKMTSDDMFHLWLDDSTKDGFQKLGKSMRVKVIKDGSCVVLYDSIKRVKNLFGILKDEVFKIRLPDASEVEYVDGVCIFSRGILWYTITKVDGVWVEQLLGRRRQVDLVWTAMHKYNRWCWTYFLKDKGEHLFELGWFINQQFFTVGTYSNVYGIATGKIAAQNEDGYFEFYTPTSIEPLEYKDETSHRIYGFEALEGVFLRADNGNGWKFHPKCSVYGKNAIIRIIGEYGNNVELYRIEGEEISIVTSGQWKWINSKKSNCELQICIEGKIYRNKNSVVDFDNPRPTFKKRIKDFFKRK